LIDHTTSYQSAIVNITLSSTIFEIFEIGEDHEMEINVKVTQPANLSMSVEWYIAEVYRPGAITLLLII